ncbi:MAG: phage holin family protein [Coriobacteriales bacterium]|nr:hypothetical protein [Actinomycetes bacterium]
MPDAGGADKDRISALIEMVADLLQTATDWVRQEAEAVIREKVVAPVQRVGLTLASALAAALLAVAGLVFLAVAAFLVLADWLTYPGALAVVGGVYLVASLGFIVVKVRLMQK